MPPSHPTDPIAPEQARHAAHWRRRTGLLALEINAGWWLDRWLPWAAVVAVAGAFLLLWARWRDASAVPMVWRSIAAAAALSALVAWLDARRRFVSLAAARVLLEERLGLDARLSAAAAGVGPWPGRRIDLDRRWPVVVRWHKPLVRSILPALILLGAGAVPVADARAAREHAIERPADVATVERWTDELRRERAIDEASAAEVQQAVEKILDRPREDWYDHASLEAAAHLRERTAAGLAEMSRNLAEASRAAAGLAAEGATDGRDARAQRERLAEAAARLASGALKPGENGAAPMAGADADRLGDLSADELAALAAALAKNRAALRAALARAGTFDLSALGPDDDGEPCEECRECEACKDGKPCDKRHPCKKCLARGARGSIQRGPGEAPMRAGRERALGSDRIEAVAGPTDVERAAAGDLLEVVDGDPSRAEQPAWTGPAAGGAATEGDGSGPANVDALLPEEKQALRRFFK